MYESNNQTHTQPTQKDFEQNRIQSHPQHTGYFCIIPNHIMFDKELEPSAKFLYGFISSLTQAEGYCWASNKYLAEKFQVDERTIKRWLETLKEKKYIVVELFKNGMMTKRKIWIRYDIQIKFTERQKCPPQDEEQEFQNIFAEGQKCPPWEDKNVPHNNKAINNKVKVSPSEIPKEPVPGSCHAPLAPDAPQEKVEVKKNEVAAALALFFFQILQHENPNMKQPNLKAWAQSIDRILRIDKRDPEEVRELMLWVIGDEFWHKNILSPDKLRKHYDRLLIEKEKQKKYKEKYANQTKLKSYKSQKMTKEEIENYIKSAEMNPDGTSKFWTQALKNL